MMGINITIYFHHVQNTMKNIYLFNILACIFMLFSCAEKRHSDALHVIKMTKEKELEQACVSDFIAKVDFIELETSENSIFGIASKLYITQNRIYILDVLKANALFVFGKDGSFIKKIGRVGSGPGEYIRVGDFFIDEKQQQILLLVNRGGQLLRMDYDGNYLGDFKLKQNFYAYMFSLGDSYVFGHRVTGGRKYLLHVMDENFEEIQQYVAIPEEYYKLARWKWVCYTGFQQNYLFAPPLFTTIYKINREGCIPKYEFDVNNAYKLTPKVAAMYDEDAFVEKTLNFFDLASFFDLRTGLFATYSVNNSYYWCVYNSQNDDFHYVNCDNLKNDMRVDPKNLQFFQQIDEDTIAGFLVDSIREEKELNPLIVICKMKDISH
jgi:hypothetical protein